MPWLVLQLISKFIPQIGLTGLYALTLITFIGFCSELLRRKRQKEDGQRTPERAHRRLGPLESAHDDMHTCGGGVRTIALLLKSRVSLPPKAVCEVLDILAAKHPILRMRMEVVEKKVRIEKPLKYFVEEGEPCDVNFYVKNKPAGNWESSFEKELLTPFKTSDELLWRIRMLKEDFDTREGWYRNALLFSGHVAILDGLSLLKLCQEFLNLLNSKYNCFGLKSEVETEICSSPLRAPLSDLLKHHITQSQFGKIMCSAKSIFNRLLQKIMGKPKNQFTSMFPPTSLTDPIKLKKTCILPRTLSWETVNKLEKGCKENRCTVHGAFIAATCAAMATMLENDESKTPLTVPISFNISVRKECNPVVTKDELGCFALDCNLKVPTPRHEKLHSDFWSFAQECTKVLQDTVSQGHHHSMLKMLNTLNTDVTKKLSKHSKNKKTAGRLDSLLSISNLGRHDFQKETPENVFDCDAVYSAKAGHNFGPIFGNNIATVNGELYWSFVYYSNVLSRDVACNFADLVFSILNRVSA